MVKAKKNIVKKKPAPKKSAKQRKKTYQIAVPLRDIGGGMTSMEIVILGIICLFIGIWLGRVSK